jgi:hypothetical protein
MKVSGITNTNGAFEDVEISIENNLLYVISHTQVQSNLFNRKVSDGSCVSLESSQSYKFEHEVLSKHVVVPLNKSHLLKLKNLTKGEIEIYINVEGGDLRKFKKSTHQYFYQDLNFAKDVYKIIIAFITGIIATIITQKIN